MVESVMAEKKSVRAFDFGWRGISCFLRVECFREEEL